MAVPSALERRRVLNLQNDVNIARPDHGHSETIYPSRYFNMGISISLAVCLLRHAGEKSDIRRISSLSGIENITRPRLAFGALPSPHIRTACQYTISRQTERMKCYRDVGLLLSGRTGFSSHFVGSRHYINPAFYPRTSSESVRERHA